MYLDKTSESIVRGAKNFSRLPMKSEVLFVSIKINKTRSKSLKQRR